MSNIVVVLGGHTLPTPNLPFTRPLEPNEAEVETLDGTLYTDFTNYRRVWNMTWGRLTAEQYEVIENIFKQQYQTGVYPMLEIDHYGVSVPVKVSMNPQSIRNDGAEVVGVEIVLKEKFAIS